MMSPSPHCKPRRRADASTALIVALAGVLAGCAGVGDESAPFYATPGRYELYDCEQLATKRDELMQREQELAGLMARAEQGAAGALVSAVAYRSDYLTAVGERKDVEKLAVDKDCDYTREWRSDAVIR